MSTIVFDEAFVQELREKPAELLEELGIEPTEEIIAAVQSLDTSALMFIAQEYRLVHRRKANVELVFP